MRYLLAVTAPTARQHKTLAVMAENVGLELVNFGEAQQAAGWLEQHDPQAVVLDLRVAGVNDVCRKVRAKRQLWGVPIIALTRQISDGEAARFYAVGVDDVLPIDANAQLLARLQQLSARSLKPPQHQGLAVIAEPEPQRSDVFSRIFINAGYDIEYSASEGSRLLDEKAAKARVVVLSYRLGDPRALIESARVAGSQAVWVVVAPRRELETLGQSLIGMSGVALIARDAPPTDALFFANELRLPPGARQRKGERRLYGTQVRFRAVGGIDADYGFSYNVSDSGMYVRTLAPPTSDRVWLEVRPPRTNEWTCLEAEVAWRRPFAAESGAAVPPGFGVKLASGLGQSLVLWKRAVRDFSRSTPHRAGSGLASLMSETLASEDLPPLIEDSVVEPAPEWGMEDDVNTLDGLVMSHDSWAPVMDEDHVLASVTPPPVAALPANFDLPPLPRRPPPEKVPEKQPNAPVSPPVLPTWAEQMDAELAQGASPPPMPQLPATVATPQALPVAKRRPAWLIGAAAASVLVLGGSVWALTGGDAAATPLATKTPVEPAALAQRAAPALEDGARPGTPPPAEKQANAALPVAEPAKAAKGPPMAALPPDNSDLKPNEGGLLVHSQGGLRVFIQGVERGSTNERFVLPCGYRYVRLQGAADGVWVSEGMSVLVTCRTTTEVELKADLEG